MEENIWTCHKLYPQIREGEMGRACSMHGRSEDCMQNLVGKADGKRHGECPGIGGRIILR
jgi:hypothetical protein